MDIEQQQEKIDRVNEDWQKMRPHADAIAEILTARYPAVERYGTPCIPDQGVEEIAEQLTFLLADIIQGWIDAGSERDNTVEELEEPILKHLKGWTPSTVQGG